MHDKTAAGIEPSPSVFAGTAFSRRVKRLWFATRPKFFAASVLPVLVGSAWGILVSGSFQMVLFALALLCTVLVHAAANVLNDVGDDVNGSDPANQDRIFPYTGGSRFIQNGIMSRRDMARWGITLLVLASILGAGLVAMAGPAVLIFGLIGVALATLYSLPGAELSARGIGEAAVAIAFGILPVSGAAWLQGGPLDGTTVLVSLPVSMWVAAILLINEVPDLQADASAGKRTLVVRLGTHGTRYLYLALHLAALVAACLASYLGLYPWIVAVLVGLLFLGAWRSSRAIDPSPGQAESGRASLQKSIETTLGIHMVGSLGLIGGILYLAF